MTNQNIHTDIPKLDKHLENSKVSWSKSKDDVWSELQESISVKRRKTRRLYITLSAAAGIILLLGLSVFMRLYTETAETTFGEHSIAKLPDGSSVELNAASQISWNPLWWKINREVRFQGEGFFNVVPGSSFSVVSNKGTTTVLGTSFNIFARGEIYSVTCVTGKVRAEATVTSQKVIINPGEQAILEKSGTFILQNTKPVKEITGWRNHMFTFTGAPLTEVWKEIERQYNVKLIFPETNHNYTGFFSRSMDLETVLDLVCRPFEFTFVNAQDRTYVISKNNARIPD
jgi:ferric-dicitrate binding protein FerR (iron transport regulator)